MSKNTVSSATFVILGSEKSCIINCYSSVIGTIMASVYFLFLLIDIH